MLTKLTVRNFKCFDSVEINLGNPVVFIGPNNSGKTTAMQALALWDIGLKRWNEKRQGNVPKKRQGVTVNRRDLLAIPHPSANLLWRRLHTRDISKKDGDQETKNVCIDIIVEGVKNKTWKCGFEFYYANPESFYCRPLQIGNGKTPDRMPIPEEAGGTNIAFLPPMSGLASTETRLDQGAVNVRIGEGRTAEVLRNLCWRLKEEGSQWKLLVNNISDLFGAELKEPLYIQERGEITMKYRENGIDLDLSSSGRGLQQTLLILAYMLVNPGSVILLDEPDAHLEILRQRQIYKRINEVAKEYGNQIIAASHSEVLLNEAADRKDMVIAFIGAPHQIGQDAKEQVRKALTKIGYEQYYQAKQVGWVLYLEGSTDLTILQAFAKRLGNKHAIRALERAFVHYVNDQPSKATSHYYGLKEALPDLKGVVLFDRRKRSNRRDASFTELIWKKREIENYVCSKSTLEAYAAASAANEMKGMPLFSPDEIKHRRAAMDAAIAKTAEAMKTGDPWGDDVKVSDKFLTPLFKNYFQRLKSPNQMAKHRFHELVEYVPDEDIDSEIKEKLEAIVRVADSASSEV